MNAEVGVEPGVSAQVAERYPRGGPLLAQPTMTLQANSTQRLG